MTITYIPIPCFDHGTFGNCHLRVYVNIIIWNYVDVVLKF